MRILMCDPLFYEIAWENPEKNLWMNLKNQPSFSKKFLQWTRLVEIYENLGIDVDFIPPVPGLCDMVFSANAGWIHESLFIPSNFAPDERKPESAHYARWFLENGFETRAMKNDVTFEGQSDLVRLPSAYLYFHGSRNSPDAPRELEALFSPDRPIIPLRLLPECGFYHGDLACFYIKKTRKLLYCPDAFDEESVSVIRSLPCDSRAIPFSLAVQRRNANERNFPLNAVDFGDTIVVPWNLSWGGIPDDLYQWLAEGGVTVKFHDFSEFAKSGAGIRCVTFIIGESRTDNPAK